MSGPLRGFGPVADRNSRVLVLGSMPGPEALRRREYYGYPGNHFWKIVGDLFGRRPRSYRFRLALLRGRGVALWDVVGSCRRTGAADSSIRRARVNDLESFLLEHPRIRRIFVNGRTAERLLKTSFPRLRVRARYLPSTSPAHASMSYARKLGRWKALARAAAAETKET